MNRTVGDLTSDGSQHFNRNTITSVTKSMDLAEDSNDINSEKQGKLDSLIDAFHTINIEYPAEYYGDLLQIHEFLNEHLDFLGLRATFPNGVTMEHIETVIITRQQAKLYQLMFIFLTTVFKYHSIEYVEHGYQSSNQTTVSQSNHLGSFTSRFNNHIYECDVSELPCDEFTISEVLRLHLITSTATLKIKGISLNDHEALNRYYAKQNVALGFIRKHPTIIQSLHHDTIYRLSSGDLLKIFICLLYQILTFDALRTKIEANSSSLSNFLGCDESNRKYWRLDSLPGIYVECINEWKHINSIENLSLLLEAVQDSTLKQNLLKHADKIAGDIFERRNQNMINNYDLRNFNSFEDWHQLWEQKFSTFQDLIEKSKLVCDKPELDFNSFKKSYTKFQIPMNAANSVFHIMKLQPKTKDTVERKLCQYHLVAEKKFSDEYLNTIQELASKLAYAYYTLNGDLALSEDDNRSDARETKYELFLRVQSVAELFIALYKFYEGLLHIEKCYICHSYSSLRPRSCGSCDRPIHLKCLELIPIVKQLTSTQCDICQFKCTSDLI